MPRTLFLGKHVEIRLFGMCAKMGHGRFPISDYLSLMSNLARTDVCQRPISPSPGKSEKRCPQTKSHWEQDQKVLNRKDSTPALNDSVASATSWTCNEILFTAPLWNTVFSNSPTFKKVEWAIKRPRTGSTAARQVSNAHERDLVTNQNV